VPNLPDGKFFIGSATNTQTSTYGLPTSDPSDGETLVYNSTTDAFEGGYPTSAGQVSTFNITTTNSQPCPQGVTTIGFGSLAQQTVTQTLRAGWSMGGNSSVNATAFNAAPTAQGSTFTVTFAGEILVQVNQGGLLQPTSQSGYFTEVSDTLAIFGTGSYQSFTLTETGNAVNIWQLTNSISFQYNHVGSSVATMRNMSLTITMNHA
jgi:hypothetical protein